VTVGILFGIITAVKQNSMLDYVVTFISLIGASVPAFWLCLLLMLVFALHLGWLPAVGFSTPKHWILPTAATAFLPLAIITRNTRSSMLEVIRQDYIRTARAKGLSEGKILTKHALKNALIPIVTVIIMQISISLAGTIVAESIFSIGGIGTLLLTALFSKNYPTIQGCTLWIGFVCCTLNLIVDLGYAWIDPRIHEQFIIKKKLKKRVQFAEAEFENSLNKR
jgi:peptide/nickel transport system permease protein